MVAPARREKRNNIAARIAPIPRIHSRNWRNWRLTFKHVRFAEHAYDLSLKKDKLIPVLDAAERSARVRQKSFWRNHDDSTRGVKNWRNPRLLLQYPIRGFPKRPCSEIGTDDLPFVVTTINKYCPATCSDSSGDISPAIADDEALPQIDRPLPGSFHKQTRLWFPAFAIASIIVVTDTELVDIHNASQFAIHRFVDW
jgi:hypothetical protein